MRRCRRSSLASVALLLASAVRAEEVARIERLDPRLDALLAPDARVERVAQGIAWAEGPLWDPAQQALLFSDVPRNGDGAITVLADRYRGQRRNSPNELVVRANGDVWFTDPPFGLPGGFDDPAKELPYQGVYRVTPDGVVSAMVTDLPAPNGLGFAPDGRTLYVSNAQHARPIWTAYPVRDDGSLGSGREFATAAAFVRDGEGVPDGLEVDARGNLFAAGPGGVHVFAPDGTRLGRIVTGTRTGNVAFGEDGATLFVTANHAILRVRTTTWGPGE